MARALTLLTAALAASSCAASRDASATAQEPGWLDERVREANAATGGYPPLSEFPTYVPQTSSLSEWRKGLSDMTAMRDEVLSDPAMEAPDAPADSETFTRESRADTARDIERQSLENE